MQDKQLLRDLLAAEDETAVIQALSYRKLLNDYSRWKYVGNMANNQSVVLAQQSSAAAALVEKITNGIDAILLRYCKAKGIDPRSPSEAPHSMSQAVKQFLGELEGKSQDEIRQLAEQALVLYATGSKARPCLSLYDAGEGQLAKDFPTTFCSLIHGANNSSYKGAIPFVQGRFNMGGTGVLPFCSEERKLQLIVSRVPKEVLGTDEHEWAFTLFCFFPSKDDPSWRYLVGTDGEVMTAGKEPQGLLPREAAKSGEILSARERRVESGTLIKLYDYKAPKSNVCGELFKKLEDYLLRPALPLRIIECRPEYKAKVMGVNVWDRLTRWGHNKLEKGFEKGASLSVNLHNGEVIPGEIRVFKLDRDKEGNLKKEIKEDEDLPETGLRALINGQSHAKRDARFFRTRAVDKEHIAGSILVTLDCTGLGQDSRNALFMSNRETFRDDTLLTELLDKVQEQLRTHDELKRLNEQRYQEKLASATSDDLGIKALEELLATDPALASLFGSEKSGRVGARVSETNEGGDEPGEPEPFKGVEFPTFICRKDKSTTAEVEIPRGGTSSASFSTDVENNYFSRTRHPGQWTPDGDKFVSGLRLFNGRMTFACAIPDTTAEGTRQTTRIVITDDKGSGPFELTLNAVVTAPREKKPRPDPVPPEPKVQAGPSMPNIKEVENGPEDPPITIEPVPGSERFILLLNKKSKYLEEAKQMRHVNEKAAVEFVFKYGLALTVMGLLDQAKQLPDWQEKQASHRDRIQQNAIGIARVIVPLCLSLPSKLPKRT